MSTSPKPWPMARLLAGLLCAWLLVPAPVQAARPPVMSMETAVLFALNQNPDIMIALEHEKQAGFAIDEARSAYYPQVTLSGKAGPEYNNPTSANTGLLRQTGETTLSAEGRVIVSQLLFDGWATDGEVDRRQALLNSATLETRSAIEKILSSTIEAYVNLWRAQLAAQESEEFYASVKKISDQINLMSAAGAESKVKKEYVDSRLASAQSERNTAQAEMVGALNDLEVQTGPLPPFVTRRPTQFDVTVRQLETYLDLENGKNTELQLTQSNSEALQFQREAQDGADYPTVSVQLEGSRSNDVGGSVGLRDGASAMVLMNYKLFDGGARDATKGRLQSQIAENNFKRARLERTVTKGIRESYNRLLATKRDLLANETEILSSESLKKLYAQQFALGDGDVINIVEGDERLHAARLKNFKLQGDMVVNNYGLLREIGALKKDQFCASC